jgi:hypothetical protein
MIAMVPMALPSMKGIAFLPLSHHSEQNGLTVTPNL